MGISLSTEELIERRADIRPVSSGWGVFQIAIWMSLVFHLLIVMGSIGAHAVLGNIYHGEFDRIPEAAEGILNGVFAGGFMFNTLLSVLFAIGYMMFFVRAQHNALQITRERDDRFTHAVWIWYLIPIGNLFVPANRVLDIWTAGRDWADGGRTNAYWLAIWWISWLVAGLFSLISSGAVTGIVFEGLEPLLEDKERLGAFLLTLKFHIVAAILNVVSLAGIFVVSQQIAEDQSALTKVVPARLR